MTASALPWPLESLPPGELDLPSEDGVPMETVRHRQQMELLIGSLSLAWKDRDDFFVGGNMFLYFSETQTVRNDFRGPDVFVVLDTTRRERRSWVVWGEDGRTPDVVIELTSPSTEAIDRGVKMGIYAERLRVPVYVLFDPFDGRLEGYALDAVHKRYRPLEPLPNGDLPCEPLGLALGLREGSHQGTEARWLRWIGGDGAVLPTGEEAAERERLRAEAERLRADRLASEVRELKERFGVE